MPVHRVEQLPHASGVRKSASHPVAAMPSQSAKLASLHMIPHTDSVHVAIELRPDGHGLPHVPQWVGSLRVFTQSVPHGVVPPVQIVSGPMTVSVASPGSTVSVALPPSPGGSVFTSQLRMQPLPVSRPAIRSVNRVTRNSLVCSESPAKSDNAATGSGDEHRRRQRHGRPLSNEASLREKHDCHGARHARSDHHGVRDGGFRGAA